jgi:hypothetical protein
MATKSKTTKREPGNVPQGEHDLVSGRKANGAGNAPAVKISTKTVKAAATKDTRPLTGKAAIKAELQEVRAANEKAHAKRMADCTEAAEQAEPEVTRVPMGASGIDAKSKALKLTSPKKMGAARTARPAKADPKPAAKAPVDVKAAVAKLRARQTRPALDVSKCNFKGIRGVEPAAARKYAELLAGDGCTPKQAETETGLVERARWKVEDRLRAGGFRLHFEKNPNRVLGDRATSNVYRIEAA